MGRNNADFDLNHLHTWDMEDEHGAGLSGAFYTPEWCVGVCVDAAESLTKHLRSKGVPAETIDAKHIDTGKPHTVTKVGDRVVDYTRRQFEPQADVPTVESTADFLKKFRIG